MISHAKWKIFFQKKRKHNLSWGGKHQSGNFKLYSQRRASDGVEWHSLNECLPTPTWFLLITVKLTFRWSFEVCYDSTLKHLCKGSVWNFLGEGVVSWGTVQGEVMWCILFMLLYHPSLQTVSFLSFQYYWLKYRCNECQTYSYKQIYRLSTTSTRISVSRGKRWTVMLQVRTRYGDGEWAKTTVVACSLVVMRPVTDLEAR